jgi:hypothetical protein
MEALPAVLVPMKLTRLPWLLMVAEPAVLVPLNVTAPKFWLLMVAEPALIRMPARLNVSAPGPTAKV